ncbi:MAG: glycerophosphodiester phosphodiesterase family protein [Flavobacteriaceae bacterium]|nr:glycerophosphodiester phosphodiesterase family protein [Flavobacteriaceae bacterium]
MNSCYTGNGTFVIGHRGAKGYFPENTLLSVSKAIEFGVDAVEVDVFLCASGELVVFHDKKVDRLTNGYGNIEQLTLDSIKKLKVLDSEKIPTLNEVLDLIDSRILINIELKGQNTAIPTAILLRELFLSSKWTPDKVIISSFIWEELKIFSNQKTSVKIAVLTEEDPIKAINIAKELNAIAINPKFTLLNNENVSIIKENGFQIHTWTVNSIEDINKMRLFGVDAIITDYPDRAILTGK